MKEKTKEKKAFIEKGMDFWFADEKGIKLFRLGIYMVAVLVWLIFPAFIVRLFWSAFVNKHLGALLFAIILTYAFLGVVAALRRILKIVKGFDITLNKVKEVKITDPNEKDANYHRRT